MARCRTAGQPARHACRRAGLAATLAAPSPAVTHPGSAAMRAAARRVAVAAVLAPAIALTCGSCTLLQPAGAPARARAPSRAVATARPSSAAYCSPAPVPQPGSDLLPLAAAQLQAAAGLAARFAAAYASHPARQAPSGWLAGLAGMATPQLQGALRRAALTPGGWPPGPPGAVTGVRARDISAAAVTFSVSLGPAPGLAVTVTPRPGGGWIVFDAEPAADGNA
jgi:hypothetical protein